MMKSQKYLLMVKNYSLKIDYLRNQIIELTMDIQSLQAVDCTKERVQSNVNPDKIADAINNLIEHQQKYERAIIKLWHLKDEIEERISSLANENYSAILNLRYLQNKSFECIAVEMNYSYRWVTTLHDRALQQFEQKYFRKSKSSY